MKTGLHCNDIHNGAQVIDYYKRTGANVFKTMEFKRDILQELKGMGVYIIGRVYFQDQPLDAAKAGRNIRKILAKRNEVPEVDGWEFYNEEGGAGEPMSAYGDVTREFIREIAASGKTPVAGCFATGNPPVMQDWNRWRGVLEELHAAKGILELHEYGWYMQWLAGSNLWNHATASPVRIDDPVTDPNADGWLCLRYRKVWRQFLEPWGLGKLPIFIGEGGSDDTTPRPGDVGAGYKAAADWCQQNNIPSYPHQRRWYMGQVSRDDGNGRPLVFGVVDFGFQDTSGRWGDFDMSTDGPTLQEVMRLEADLPRLHFSTPPPVTPPTPPPPEVTMLTGIDVSHYQGSMEWAKAKAAGAAYAWIKATEGTGLVDSEYARNVAGAQAAGLLAGPYHFYKNAVDPIQQAEHFARIVKAAGAFTLPPALDFEDTNGAPDAANMRRFTERVAALLGKPIIYTGRGWWATVAGDVSWAGAYPLWIARYSATDKPPVVLPPIVPAPWSDWTVHQWSSRGDGRDGRDFGADSVGLDVNRTRLTRAQLAALRVPPPGETPAPAGPDLAALIAAAEAEHKRTGIRINVVGASPSAIQKAMQADGVWPTTNEAVIDGTAYMRGQDPRDGSVWLYQWRAGKTRRDKYTAA